MIDELLSNLIAATPLPPVDVELEALLAAFQEMHARRQEILGSVPPQRPTCTADQQRVLAELALREAAWAAALAGARSTLLSHRHGIAQLRQYAAVIAGGL